MFGLKTDTYTLNTNGNGQYELFADVSTRSLQSVLVGEGAGKISKGSGNAFVGFESGKQNLKGSFGVFVGFQAGALNQNGNWNTYVGAYAGKNNNRGDRNTFVGFQAGQLNADGSECTAVGVNAMRENSVGNRNVAVGTRAGERILNGDNNTMIGAEAGQDIRSGNLNTMAGYRSGRASFRGNENTYFGAYAGYSNSYGDGNAFVGYKAGEYLTFGNFNVAVGAYALQRATYGSCNIAIGAFAGSVTTGSGNVFVGTGAGASNTSGDNNTNIGNNAGYYGTGGENVYIGKDAALRLLGDQNVVIGVNAYPGDESSGSVVIGHHAASTVFKTGSCNIFIGIGADAHTENVSYAIAIGSKDTRANTTCISVGETIDNGGLNSVLLGYGLYSDADQCVSIGHDVQVNSVDVFDDPLNWKFPVQVTQGYKKFYLKENYSNVLYLGGVSNTYAIATIYASNIYDSGDNPLKGVIRTTDLNLRELFDYNILYQGNMIQQTQITDINTTFKEYLSNINNRIIADNFNANLIIIPDTSFIINNSSLSTDSYNVQMNIASLYNTCNISVSCNLIPTTTIVLPYKILIGKRILIDTIETTCNIYESFLTKETFLNTNQTISIANNRSIISYNINDYPDEIQPISTLDMVYNYKYYMHKEPNYGIFNSNIYNDTNVQTPILYTPYPEGMYACNDIFSLVITNELKNKNSTNPGIYGSIPEENKIQYQSVLFNSNQYVSMTSNIYLHPQRKTYIDRSYLNVIPYPPKEFSSISFLQMDPNLLLQYNGTSYTYTGIGTLIIPYDTFTTKPLTLEVINNKVDTPISFGIRFKETDYYYNCIYSSNINYSSTYNSNIEINIATFNLQPLSIPYKTDEYTYITEYPKYGTVGIPTGLSYPITYTPFTYNFGDDQFTIITGNSIANYSYVTVKLHTSNSYRSLILNKMQENIRISDSTYIYTNYNIQVNSSLYFNTVYSINQISTLNGTSGNPWSVPNTTQLYQLTDPYAYLTADGGYRYNCNISVASNYTVALWSDVNALYPGEIPNETTIPSPLGGRDYVVYDSSITSNPKAIYSKYKWNYSINQKETIPYSSVTIEIPTSPYYTINNGTNLNRYYFLEYNIQYQEIYKYGCNLAIYHSNEFLWHDNYYDLYNNYIYTSNYSIPNTGIRTSNINYIEDTISTPTYTRIDNSIRTERYIASNIPTIQLQDSIIYEYQGHYSLSNVTSNNMVFLKKDIGTVREFDQSSITQKEIHLWNTQPSQEFIHFKQQSNVFFNNNKGIVINYFKNDTSTQTLDGNAADINQFIDFTNGTTNALYLKYASGNNFQNIAIQHTCNISFVNSTTKEPSLCYNFDSDTANESLLTQGIIGTGFSNDSFVDYINYGNTDARMPIRKYIPTTYYINKPVYLNTGIQNTKTYLTSNELLYMRYTFAASDIQYKILNIGADIFLYKNNSLLTVGSTFTQNDINCQQLFIKGNFIGNKNINFDIQDSNENPYKTSQTLIVSKYLNNEFLPASYSNTTCNVLLHTNNTYSHQLLGSIWNYMDSNISINENVQQVNFYLTKNPAYGYLYSSNLAFMYGSNMINKFSLTELQTHKIHYIPYLPMSLSNDTIEGFFSYSNIISPIYTLPIKNYWSKWGQRVIPVNNIEFEDTSVYDNSNVYSYYTSNLYISDGMKQDGIKWSPSYISLPGLSLIATNLNTSTSTPISLNYENITETLDIITEPISQRPYFVSSNTVLEVDTANYTYFSSLLNTISNPLQKVQFFISEAPTGGIILKQQTENQFTTSPYFSSDDIEKKRVFYQNYGSLTATIDSFKLQVGTHPYNLSSNFHTVTLKILPTPKLLTNSYDYIYYSNLSTGKSNYNILDKTQLELSSGSVYIYQQSNIDLFKKEGINYLSTNVFTKEDIDSHLIYYRPSTQFFQYNSNENKAMSFKFITNSNTNVVEPNKLAVFDIYKNIYQQEWFSKYNTFDSVNNIIEYIDSNQAITYSRFVDTSCNLSFYNKKCTIQFDYLPYQSTLINTQNQNSKIFGDKYLDFLKTYKYSYELIDIRNYSFFRVDFTQQSIRVYTSNIFRFEINASNETNFTNSLFDFTTIIDWNTFYMINQDDQNNRNLSIYFNNKNYTDYNQTANVIESLSLEHLKQIKISVPIYDPLNYYNYTITSNIDTGTNIYYNLVNYNNQVRFRNFRILLGTYDLGTSTQSMTIDGGLYNIVIGDQLKINGFNNICVGKNFSTTGTGSIILGSDIGVLLDESGVPSGSFNEIFNSIVISTSSFINSKVRDVIAIGNNIFNDVGGNIDDFLSKKPVLVGNDIDETKIDFHINFQNSFLKTTVGYPQIYCGLQEEPVCIGYTSNQQFSNTDEYKLHVNGGVSITGPIMYSNGTNTFSKKNVFGNILFNTGTSHRCKVRIYWTNIQTTNHTAFSINIKFRFIRDNGSYGYRRFELWVTPINNQVANTPNLLSDLEISSFSTADIQYIEHNVERDGPSSINVFITWNTLNALTITNYILGTMEIETVVPIGLGNIYFETPISV